jgi:hypothetical protein
MYLTTPIPFCNKTFLFPASEENIPQYQLGGGSYRILTQHLSILPQGCNNKIKQNYQNNFQFASVMNSDHQS